MVKPGTYVNEHVQRYMFTKFGDLKNDPRNAQSVKLIKWSIMCIFHEAEHS